MAGEKVKRLFLKAIDTVLPPRCPMTGELVDGQGMIASSGWARLQFIANPICDCCGHPFLYGMEDGGLCLACLEKRPVYSRARAALRYDDASRELILGFKHGDKTHSVISFIPLLRQAGRDLLSEVDVLMPVPLHPYRLIRRRYNQAGLIAQGLSKETGIVHWPLALRRVRATPTQGHMNMEQRVKNVRKAFAVHSAYAEKIIGKRILLIDDVFTTGATVSECTKILIKSGAQSVDILTVARVVKQV